MLLSHASAIISHIPRTRRHRRRTMSDIGPRGFHFGSNAFAQALSSGESILNRYMEVTGGKTAYQARPFQRRAFTTQNSSAWALQISGVYQYGPQDSHSLAQDSCTQDPAASQLQLQVRLTQQCGSLRCIG